MYYQEEKKENVQDRSIVEEVERIDRETRKMSLSMKIALWYIAIITVLAGISFVFSYIKIKKTEKQIIETNRIIDEKLTKHAK